MSRILGTDGVSILSRYMVAMTAVIASTAASLTNNGSENERSNVPDKELLRAGNKSAVCRFILLEGSTSVTAVSWNEKSP